MSYGKTGSGNGKVRKALVAASLLFVSTSAEVLSNPEKAAAAEIRTAMDIPAGSLRLVIGCETNFTFKPAVVFKSARLVLKGIGVYDPTFVGSQVLSNPEVKASVVRNNGAQSFQYDYMSTRGAPLNESNVNLTFAANTDSVLPNADVKITPLSGPAFILHADFDTGPQSCSAISSNGLYAEKTFFPTGVVAPPVNPPPRSGPLQTGQVLKVHPSKGKPGDKYGFNLTGVNKAGATYLAAYPCAEGVPQTSNLNMGEVATDANFAEVQSDTGGDICIVTGPETGPITGPKSPTKVDVIVDIFGVESPANALYPTPERLVDTRNS